MPMYKTMKLLALLLSISIVNADDVNEDLCGRVDLDGPVQAIQYKLESLYSGSDSDTDATVAEIKSNFEDLTKKADKISDDCDRKTPKLLGFINQMNQARQCIEALNNHQEMEAQNECQAVHDEAKLNFVVRTVVNDSQDYNALLKTANTFTDLVQRVKMYRAILREEDRGDKESNKLFYETVKQLIKKKNTPATALKDILKNIAKKSILDKDLKFTDMELMEDLHDYDDKLANTAVTELVTQVYNQNNYTANHLLYLPLLRSRVAAIIAVYNKSKDHVNDNLAKKIYQVIYISRLRPDYKMVDVNSRKQIENIYETLTKTRPNLKGFGFICIDVNEANFTDGSTDAMNDYVVIRSESKNGDMDDWKFKVDDKGDVLSIYLDGPPRTKLFLSRDEYSDEDVAILGTDSEIGKWNKLGTSEVCSINEEMDQYVCVPGTESTSKEIFDDPSVESRKLIFEGRIKARQSICPKI